MTEKSVTTNACPTSLALRLATPAQPADFRPGAAVVQSCDCDEMRRANEVETELELIRARAAAWRL